VAARLTSLLPRVIALTAILVLGSATISFAAENTLLSPAPKSEPAAAPTPLVSVPDVRGQAYVFAKGTLEERGFAWRVVGSVAGYPANTVVSQTPAAGTRIVDTGLPTIMLSLDRGEYAQEGTPENASPYTGTKIRFLRPRPAAASKAKPKVKPKTKPKVKPKTKPKVKPKAKPKAKPKPKVTPARPTAFPVAGAPNEPQDELALPERARRLEQWLSTHSKPTNANVQHWLYQHEWLVTGARFGWWRGAEALEILVRVDQEVQRSWGIGAKSEAAARRALAAVRAKNR
jgi:hypothetical protein